jgi:hypothetical protein
MPDRSVGKQSFNERLALSILTRDGIAAIWKLNEAAADAHRTGHPRSAAAVLDLADAAEAAWMGARECLTANVMGRAIGAIERLYRT